MTHNEKMHRKLWNWLADNPDKDKFDFFDFFKILPPKWSCYACAENEKRCTGKIENINDCPFCPITDISSVNCCGGLYYDWEDGDIKYRSAIARQIAELPWIEKE